MIRITDVTLRDGLQMGTAVVPVEKKLELWNRLRLCAYSRLEITSFVSPKWMPQFADAEEFCRRLFAGNPEVDTMAFAPNDRGLDRLLTFPIPWVGAFIAASESFNRKNVNASIEESLQGLGSLVARIHSAGRKARVYVSTVFGCPYEGPIRGEALMTLLKKVAAFGPDEMALSDTIGVASPGQVKSILREVAAFYPVEKTALHLHNTYGMGLAAAVAAYECGIRNFDGSTGGVGGCPYAKGASGNLATDELLYLFHREGNLENFPTDALAQAFSFLAKDLNLVLHSRLWSIMEKGAKLYAIE